MENYISQCCNLICAHFGWSEYYVLWHDWHWIGDKLRFINSQRMQERRWNLMSTAAAMALVMGGEESGESYRMLIEHTYTPEERQALAEEEEREIMRQMEEQRAEREAMMRASGGLLSM